MKCFMINLHESMGWARIKLTTIDSAIRLTIDCDTRPDFGTDGIYIKSSCIHSFLVGLKAILFCLCLYLLLTFTV